MSTSSNTGLTLRAMPVAGLLVLRADATRTNLAQALESVAGLALPSALGSTGSGDRVLRWMSPDEWLLSCSLEECADLEKRLAGKLDGHVAIVDTSGGFLSFELSGPATVPVLNASTPYDVHVSNFPVGKVVNTTFAKVVVTMRAIETDASGPTRVELVVRRSHADYLVSWLESASREYGLSREHGLGTRGDDRQVGAV